MSLFESRLAQEAADPFGSVWIEVDANGHRTVREAGGLLQINVPWMRDHYPDMVRDDGALQLDSDGEYVYREAEGRFPTLRDGFTAYERVQA